MSGSSDKKPPYFILGDWGTSNSRFYLCAQDAHATSFKLIDNIEGKGVKSVEDVKSYCLNLLADWISAFKPELVVLSGMVGSNLGWQVVPYLRLPVSVKALAEACATVQETSPRIVLVPGLQCRNHFDNWDVMRGEEIQVLGALHLYSQLSREESSLICLPGTHCKWVQVRKGKIHRFLTGFGGELFELLKQHSILLPRTIDGTTRSLTGHEAVFLRAVASVKNGNSALLHRLFTVRSIQLIDNLSADEAASYLSGLIIGCDIKDALAIYAAENQKPINSITVIANDQLLARYKMALELFAMDINLINAAEASLSGLFQIYENVSNSNATSDRKKPLNRSAKHKENTL